MTLLTRRLNYYRRVLGAYLTTRKSHLTFWHGVPEVNTRFVPGKLGEYYMPFAYKADYPGEYDSKGIPLLNYQGKVGLQYNPIAISQYGLGNFNLFVSMGDPVRRTKFLTAADWLVDNLEQNFNKLWVWNHHFDWEYRTLLKKPWYSALAQGQGISVLTRAYLETSDSKYLEAAALALDTFQTSPEQGGVRVEDQERYTWFEETIVEPPTHILNGFIWASWGLYDYYLCTGDTEAKNLFEEAVHTLRNCLHQYDVGYWSLYEQSGTRMKMLASPFYHRLHIVQLKVMHLLTGDGIFQEYAIRWDNYRKNFIKRNFAFVYKVVFKALYY